MSYKYTLSFCIIVEKDGQVFHTSTNSRVFENPPDEDFTRQEGFICRIESFLNEMKAAYCPKYILETSLSPKELETLARPGRVEGRKFSIDDAQEKE